MRWRLANTPEARAKKAAAMRRKWQNPEYRERVLAARKEANTPEVIARRGAGVSRYNAAHRDEVTERVRRAVKVREERRAARK